MAAFLSWPVSERNNAATTVNHRLSDIRGFCRYLLKKKAVTPDEYEEIRETSDVSDDRITDFTWLQADEASCILKSAEDNRDAISNFNNLSRTDTIYCGLF